ncbi:MAG: hypothetical protein ACF8MF_01500 [Phycisphaerales bacterium JB052]
MFAKLVVLILVFGASGIGVLSVRQSRLQAVHEMAESRHRVRQLDEQAGEIRAMIARACTPQRVHRLLQQRGYYAPAAQSPAELQLVQRAEESATPLPNDAMGVNHDQDLPEGSVVMTLEDGTRVVFVRE